MDGQMDGGRKFFLHLCLFGGSQHEHTYHKEYPSQLKGVFLYQSWFELLLLIISDACMICLKTCQFSWIVRILLKHTLRNNWQYIINNNHRLKRSEQRLDMNTFLSFFFLYNVKKKKKHSPRGVYCWVTPTCLSCRHIWWPWCGFWSLIWMAASDKGSRSLKTDWKPSTTFPRVWGKGFTSRGPSLRGLWN